MHPIRATRRGGVGTREPMSRLPSSPRARPPTIGAPLLVAVLLVAVAPPAGAAWVPADLTPLHHLDEMGGHLGWKGVAVGMTLSEIEAVVGEDLPPPAFAQQILCPYHRLDVRVDGQLLHLDFAGAGADAELRSVVIPLPVARGETFDTATVVETLRAGLELRFVPSPHAPEKGEAELEKPLYRTPRGELVFVNPEIGVVFGQVCVD